MTFNATVFYERVEDVFTESAHHCQNNVVGGRTIIWLIIAM